MLAELVGQERVTLVPAVVAHPLAEQAGGDPDAKASRLLVAHDLV
jgi:hypothetical protein